MSLILARDVLALVTWPPRKHSLYWKVKIMDGGSSIAPDSQGVFYCGGCGKPHPADARFCAYCARPVGYYTAAYAPMPQPSPIAPRTPLATAQAGSNALSTIIIVLLVLLGLFWLGIGLLQLGLGLNNGDGGTAAVGIWNIAISVANLWLIKDVLHRSPKVVRSLRFLAIGGSVIGLAQLVLVGAWLQVFAVPLYIVLGVLAWSNRDYFADSSDLRAQGRWAHVISDAASDLHAQGRWSDLDRK